MHQPDFQFIPDYNAALVYPGGSKVMHNDQAYVLPERAVVNSFGMAIVVPLTAYPGNEPGVGTLWQEMKH